MQEAASLALVTCAALIHIQEVKTVHWSDYYPENARVPRLDPSWNLVIDGVEHYPTMPSSTMRCCNCGLEHKVSYSVRKVVHKEGNNVIMEGAESPDAYQVGVTAWRL